MARGRQSRKSEDVSLLLFSVAQVLVGLCIFQPDKANYISVVFQTISDNDRCALLWLFRVIGAMFVSNKHLATVLRFPPNPFRLSMPR